MNKQIQKTVGILMALALCCVFGSVSLASSAGAPVVEVPRVELKPQSQLEEESRSLGQDVDPSSTHLQVPRKAGDEHRTDACVSEEQLACMAEAAEACGPGNVASAIYEEFLDYCAYFCLDGPTVGEY